ncbi:MAG: hypothetical protein GX795_08685 [Firmicutes bacterium]|nr:hypothetical protein [Bacillota bacterium]
MNQALRDLAFKLIEAAKERGNSFNSLVGFDGFIDEIFRVIKRRRSTSEYELFQTIQEFADYIQEHSGRSSDLEILLQEVKLGGNAPILANALAELGSHVSCIGTFGKPELHKVFTEVSPNCQLTSLGEPNVTHAFEFNDGKLMFGQTESLNNIDWTHIKAVIGLPTILSLVEASEFIGITNWSATIQMDSILEGLLNQVFPFVQSGLGKSKYCFFDIADPSRRQTEELRHFLSRVSCFSAYSNVILGLNEKEAEIVFKVLRPERRGRSINQIGKAIFDALEIQCLVIHETESAIGFSGEEIQEVPGFYVRSPRLSTGGGDNFNAGFGLGWLLGFSLQESLILGNSVSSFYVANGFSPTIDQLIQFLLVKSDEDI